MTTYVGMSKDRGCALTCVVAFDCLFVCAIDVQCNYCSAIVAVRFFAVQLLQCDCFGVHFSFVHCMSCPKLP